MGSLPKDGLDDRSSEQTTISIVVVGYERELGMLELLARSIARFVSPDLVSEIVFVDNSYSQPDFRYRFEARVLPSFGPMRELVRYVKAIDLGVVLDGQGSGYSAQQALKLEAGRIVANPYYLVLDAKNHLVSPLLVEDLFGDDGRPLSEYTTLGGYLATCRRVSFAFWGQDVAEHERSLPTVTPYLMVTSIVRAMLDEIVSASGMSVQSLIKENDRRTEFLLYAGYVERNWGAARIYRERERPCATLFARWPERDDEIMRVIDSTQRPRVYAMGVHSKRYSKLTDNQAEAISGIWVKAGLFDRVEAGLAFIERQRTLLEPPGLRSNDVLVGRGGRMSIGHGTNRLVDQHLGSVSLNDADVERWRRTIDLRDAYCRVRGIDYAFLVAPDTYSIHAEDFEDFGPDSATRPIRRILDVSPNTGRVVYPLSRLRAGREAGIVCHTADSHWTGYGAYLAYSELQSAIPWRLRPFSEDSLEVFHRVGPGDLGDKFGPSMAGEYSECVVRSASARPVWNNGVSNRGYMGMWKNEREDLPRGVLFMDSYGWKLQRFLAESFSSMFVIHSPYFEWYPVDAYRPDVVINLMAERFLVRIPDDHTAEPALTAAQAKAPGARYPTRAEFERGDFVQ